MIRRLLPAVLLLAFAAVTGAVEPDPNCTAPASTFELIQRGIFERRDCTMSYCHGADRQAGLDLRADSAYENLLRGADEADRAPDQPGGFKLVVPGRPEESLLWLALAKKTLQLPNVDAPPMPQDGLPLSRDELEGIRLWILAGAPEAGVVGRVANLIDPCPPLPDEDDDISALPQCKWGDPLLLLPSLSADPPADVRLFAQNGRRRVEFTTRVGNTGDGPLIIQAATLGIAPGHTVDAMQVILRKDGSKCVHRAGTMRLTEERKRWQYGNFADFELRRDDPVNGPLLASSSKPAFCLVDSDVIRGYGSRPHQYELHCSDPIGRMGISVGYKDTYSRVVPTQWIDLDADPAVPIERGTYYLINVADPSNHLWEKDDKRDDNLNYTPLSVGLADPDEPRPQPTQAPRQDRTVRPPLPHRTVGPARTVHTPRSPHPQRTPRAVRPAHPVRPPRPSRPTPALPASN